MHRGLSILLALLILVSTVPVVEAQEEPIRAGFRVAVVLFDPNQTIDLGSLQDKVALGVEEGLDLFRQVRVPPNTSVSLDLSVDVDYYQAPAWAIEALTTSLQSLYQDNTPPDWAPSDIQPPRGYAWLDVLDAYWTIWNVARAVIEDAGCDASYYHAITVLIGDLDGVSRVYFREAPYRFVPEGKLRVEGLRAWGGPAPMTFYDLATVVKPWPSYRVPFDTEAPPASPSTEPPIWVLDDPTDYAVGLVVDDILYHVLGDWVYAVPYQEVNATIIIVDYGDPEATQNIHEQVSPGEIERLTHMLAPWISLNITIQVVEAPPELVEAYQTSLQEHGSPVPLYYEAVVGPLEAIAKQAVEGRPVVGNASISITWPFIVLATPEPAYLQWRGWFNFTGYSAGWYGVTTYPGWDDRVHRSGLPAVIAHELGHSLGEGHPFQLPDDSVRWLMDMQATIMSYMDYGIVAYGQVYAYSITRLSMMQTIALLTLFQDNYTIAERQEILGLLEQGAFQQARELALHYLVADQDTPPTETTTTQPPTTTTTTPWETTRSTTTTTTTTVTTTEPQTTTTTEYPFGNISFLPLLPGDEETTTSSPTTSVTTPATVPQGPREGGIVGLQEALVAVVVVAVLVLVLSRLR